MEPHEQAAQIANAIQAESDDFDCICFQEKLRQKTEDDGLDEKVRAALKPLCAVASYRSKHENGGEPYGPLMQTSEGRSPIPSDLSEQELSILENIAAHLEPSVLRARTYDVLWLRKRSPEYAASAIEEFLSCANRHFDLEHWTHRAEYAERALRLGALFKRKTPQLFEQASTLLLSWVHEHAKSDQTFLTARAIKLLLDFGAGDVEELLEVSKESATRSVESHDFHRAEEFWKLAVIAARKSKNEEAANLAQAGLAESYASNARQAGKGMTAAHWMQQAVEAYKAVPKSKERREELYAELLDFQAQSLEEMGQFETPMDMSDCIAQTVETIAGKSFREALFSFAFVIAKVPDYEKLRKHVEELAQKFPFSHLFGAVHLDGEGKVVAKSSGALESDKVPPHSLYRSAALEHQISVAGCILPATDIMTAEHPVTLDEIDGITINNPFVAPGQQHMWAKGLFAGFQGEYEVALPIIVPLLENSLRHILGQSGARTSTLNTHGVQEELRISAILDHESMKEILGNDLVLDLKGLLQERTYGNLRNIVSHGLGTLGTFYSAPAIYLWWLCFRLVLTPYAKQLSESSASEI